MNKWIIEDWAFDVEVIEAFFASFKTDKYSQNRNQCKV